MRRVAHYHGIDWLDFVAQPREEIAMKTAFWRLSTGDPKKVASKRNEILTAHNREKARRLDARSQR